MFYHQNMSQKLKKSIISLILHNLKRRKSINHNIICSIDPAPNTEKQKGTPERQNVQKNINMMQRELCSKTEQQICSPKNIKNTTNIEKYAYNKYILGIIFRRKKILARVFMISAIIMRSPYISLYLLFVFV